MRTCTKVHQLYHFFPALNAITAASFLGSSIDADVAPSQLRDRHGNSIHLPCVASGHRTSQLVVEAAVLPPQLREATQPAPPAYHTYECGSSLPGEAVGHPHRRANARAMRRSCASHRGGGGVVEAWRSHQTTRKRMPRQRVVTRLSSILPRVLPHCDCIYILHALWTVYMHVGAV